jgi:hypothetical protein
MSVVPAKYLPRRWALQEMYLFDSPMKAAIALPFVAILSDALSVPPPTAPEVQMLPPVIRKDTVAQRIRYGPHHLKKATVICLPS